MQMIRVKKVEYLCEYKLKILFSDGKTKIVDFKDWISEGKGYFKPLKDIEFFKSVHLDDCKYSICWSNGADFCPDVLYAMGQDVRKSHVIKHLKKTQNRSTKPSARRKRKINTPIK